MSTLDVAKGCIASLSVAMLVSSGAALAAAGKVYVADEEASTISVHFKLTGGKVVEVSEPVEEVRKYPFFRGFV